METSYNITIHIKPDVVYYASLYSISYNNLFNLAYENAAELVNEINEINPDTLNDSHQGYLDGDDYTCTWQVKKENDKYFFDIIDIRIDRAPEDTNAEEEIIDSICK